MKEKLAFHREQKNQININDRESVLIWMNYILYNTRILNTQYMYVANVIRYIQVIIILVAPVENRDVS